jgi:hypothetical protein
LQPDLHLDGRALERVAQVLRLRRALRAPADHADLLHALERLREQREQVAAAAHHVFDVALGQLESFFLEHLRLEIL